MIKFLIAFALSLSFIACKQTNQVVDKDKERLNKVCDRFMQIFSEGQYKKALELVKQNSVLEPAQIDTLLATIEYQSRNIFPAYGKIESYEFIQERKIKDFIAKRLYILKFEKYPIKFDFTLYKSSNGWKITSFTYNEEFIELLY